MSAVRAGPAYDPVAENQFRDDIRRKVAECQRKGDHMFSDKNKFVLRSPDGQRWALTVDNDGVLSAEAFG